MLEQSANNMQGNWKYIKILDKSLQLALFELYHAKVSKMKWFTQEDWKKVLTVFWFLKICVIIYLMLLPF